MGIYTRLGRGRAGTINCSIPEKSPNFVIFLILRVQIAQFPFIRTCYVVLAFSEKFHRRKRIPSKL